MQDWFKRKYKGYFPTDKAIYNKTPYNNTWVKAARATYYGLCLATGVAIALGIVALLMMLMAQLLMHFYATAPAIAIGISTFMMGLADFGVLASNLAGVFLIGPWLFSKTAWLFKLTPSDEPYNMMDALRDFRDSYGMAIMKVVNKLLFWLSWADEPKDTPEEDNVHPIEPVRLPSSIMDPTRWVTGTQPPLHPPLLPALMSGPYRRPGVLTATDAFNDLENGKEKKQRPE